jgi:uncharacterized protein
MKKQVLFIHSAGPQRLHEGSTGLTTYLKESLGDEFYFSAPAMPAPENPAYSPWKVRLEKALAELDGKVILIGHSLGGSVLLKYLSETTHPPDAAALFLVASPYWSEETGWESDDFALLNDFASRLPTIGRLVLIGSRNDEIVPSSHLKLYKQKLPQAELRLLDSGDHLFQHGLPELLEEIKKL